MTADPTIRAALEAAAEAIYDRHYDRRTNAALAIAAFHRRRAADLIASNRPGAAQEHLDLAAAVEEAARHD